jgi:hypothetical protein
MSFAPGQFITAQRLNRLQPATYTVEAAGTVAASQTNADIPGVTQTFTTETDNAEAECTWSVDWDNSGAQTGTGTSRLLLDGATSSTRFIAWAGEVATDRGIQTQIQQFIIPTAGSHTIKAQATTLANQTIGQYSAMRIVVNEVV